ncbi:hypothetical protein ABN028_20115 [Actinopolymorpha sp. B17G11]|uniref:hypothetical protein n=1 Tax=Actinopolymorpha sp. B17G11 TaxID=3160861 RepID=UPI0032E5013B
MADDRARFKRAAALDAKNAGAADAAAGKPLESCPFDPSGDPQERFRAHWWIRGYRSHTQGQAATVTP